MEKYLLEIKGLRTTFNTMQGKADAIRGVDLTVRENEILGIVGESGSGKSVTMKSLLGLLPRSAKISAETLRNAGMSRARCWERVLELLKLVNMNADDMDKFSYEFSGGQRQRIGIARAVANYPEFIFCDEPISALDVSVQAQVVNMLKDLQKAMGLTYLFAAHDLSMLHHISDRIGVMYLGSMVELGTSEEVFNSPIHPYTRALISAIPIADPETARRSSRIPIEGELPSPLKAPKGCRFCTRCPHATEKCREWRPEFREITPGHWVACHFAQAEPAC